MKQLRAHEEWRQKYKSWTNIVRNKLSFKGWLRIWSCPASWWKFVVADLSQFAQETLNFHKWHAYHESMGSCALKDFSFSALFPETLNIAGVKMKQN